MTRTQRERGRDAGKEESKSEICRCEGYTEGLKVLKNMEHTDRNGIGVECLKMEVITVKCLRILFDSFLKKGIVLMVGR